MKSKNIYPKFLANASNERTRKKRDAIYNLRVPESEKYEKDKQWFKDYMDYVAPAYVTNIDDYDDLKKSYDILNSDLGGFKKDLDNFLNPLGENIGQIEENILAYPKLHNKTSILKGEMIKRKDTLKVVLMSSKAIRDKNTALLNAIKASVEELVLLEIEKTQMELEGKSQQEIQDYINQLRTQMSPEDILNKNFMSEWEIFYNKALKFCYFDQDITRKKMETFEDVVVADRCFIYSGWRFGRPYLEVRNPLYTEFQKSPNDFNIHKSADYILYRKPITISDAITAYGDDLTDDDIEDLGAYSTTGNNKVDKRHGLGKDNKMVFDHTNEHLFKALTSKSGGNANDMSVGLAQGTSGTKSYSHDKLIWETHLEFKAFKEIGFLSYADEYNEKIVIPVPGDYDYPKDAEKIEFINQYHQKSKKYVWFDVVSNTEYELEKLFIPWKYELIRLGSDTYPIIRSVPFQSVNLDNPFSNFSLSTFGGIFSARNTKSISLLQRAIPAYFQYLFTKHIQNRELAKYQGAIQSIDLDQIPDALGKDLYGNEIRDKVSTYLYYLKRTNKDFFSGSQNSLGGLPPATRSPGSSGFMIGTAVELLNLQNLIEYLDREIGMAMGISPQRESNFETNSNVSDNQQAISASHTITEPYYFLHSEIWKDALNDYLKNFRTYAEQIFKSNPKLKEHMLHYILPDGTEELMKITPDMLEHTDIGLFLSNSGRDLEYMETMKQMSHAFAQNSAEHGITTVSSIIKAITSGSSPEEVHKMIVVEQQKQQERLMKQQEQQLESNQRIAEMQKQAEQEAHDREVEKITIKGEFDLEAARIKSVGFGENQDINQDGIPDALQLDEFRHRQQNDTRKLDQKDKEIKLKEKEMSQKKDIEEKKINISRDKTNSNN